jgi:hypothetical protein
MKYQVGLQIILGIALTVTAHGQILSDNFDDGVIDASKWQTILPFGQSSLVESGGGMTTTGRGILVAVPELPMSYSITGSFKRNDSLELFKIVLRSDLSLSPGLEQYSERKGIQIAFSDIPSIAIENHVSGGGVGPMSYPINPGEWFNFQILDDGSNVSLSINGTQVISLATSDRAGNRLAIYSREFPSTSSTFDNLVVTEVPEPAASVSLLVGATLAVFSRKIQLESKS